MAVDDGKDTLCWAGRWAFLEGRWAGIPPCRWPPRHVIAAPGLDPQIRLCDPHFWEADSLGFVTDPYIGIDEYRRRRSSEGRDTV